MARKTRIIRTKKEPLPAWEDKINRAVTFDGRDDIVAEDVDFVFEVIVWHCTINMFGNIVPKLYVAVKAIPKRAHTATKELLPSPYGLFCNHCLTNEYLRSNNDHVPVSKRSSKAGQYCVCCGAS